MAQLRVLAAAPRPRDQPPAAPAPARAPRRPTRTAYERVQPGDPEASGAARAPALDTLSPACIAKHSE